MKVFKNVTEKNAPYWRLTWWTNYSILTTITMPLSIIVEKKLEEDLKDWEVWFQHYRNDKRLKKLYDNFKVLNLIYKITPLGPKPGLAPNDLEYKMVFYVRFQFIGNLFAGVTIRDIVKEILEHAKSTFKVDSISIDEIRIGSEKEFVQYERGEAIGAVGTSGIVSTGLLLTSFVGAGIIAYLLVRQLQ